MPDLQTRILEIEADDDIGRLSRALEAVIKECQEAQERARDGYPVDEHREGQAHLAVEIQDAILDALGADDD